MSVLIASFTLESLLEPKEKRSPNSREAEKGDAVSVLEGVVLIVLPGRRLRILAHIASHPAVDCFGRDTPGCDVPSSHVTLARVSL